MNERIQRFSRCFRILAFALIAGCGASAGHDPARSPNPEPLSPADLNLIFVVSADLAFHDTGDIDPGTANLTSQGLQRSLGTATFLAERVLGGRNVTSIHALEPTTHPQTSANYPDMAALGSIQQFALLNQITLSSDGHGSNASTGDSYPVSASYAAGFVPEGVVAPTLACGNCQGIDFRDQGSSNDALLSGLVASGVPGYHVFAAPWETTRALLARLDELAGFDLRAPAEYEGANRIHAVSIDASGRASLATFDSGLDPSPSYPELPGGPLASAPCTSQQAFSITVNGGRDGVIIPARSNVNQVLHIVRHADAHPSPYFADGNFVGAGQWRALGLPDALRGKIDPEVVYSIDPSQVTQGTVSASGDSVWSNVAPALTVEPYAIATGLPYQLVTSFEISDASSPQLASELFFDGGRFSNREVLLAWQYVQIPQLVNALLASRGATARAPEWPATDYDTIWTVTLDAAGDVTVSNTMCEGIDSAALPAMAPRF